jgi:hypothetical protein
MDPISTAASVITLLGAAAGTIKVVHDTINSIIDAPNDIKRQSERLGHISITLASVVHACEQLPDDCHLDLELRGIGELIEDAKLLEAKLNTRGTRMMRNNFSKIHGSCKWLLADRQFKRFFESLDQWNTILLQTLGVIQLFVNTIAIDSLYQMLMSLQDAVETNLCPDVVVNEPSAPHPPRSTDRPTDCDENSLRYGNTSNCL